MRNRSGITAEPDQEETELGISERAASTDDAPALPKKNRAAAAMGRKGGRKGGRVRAERLSPEERKASARQAASVRWAKPPSELTSTDQPMKALDGEILSPGGDAPPPSPFAKFRGQLDLGGNLVDVYVLDTGERVISMRGAVKAMTSQDAGNLVEYISIQGLKDFINKDLVLVESKDFFIPGTQFRGRGITAEQFEAILTAYVKALNAGTLTTPRQREIAITCAILSTAFLRIGIIAQIDEATGYQYVRAEDALQLKLRAFIADELRDWYKTFPDELWEQFGRLTNWKGGLHSRPKWWGHLVMELIYDALDPDIAKYLRENKPKPYHGQNYHQWFTEDIGLKALIPHIYKIIGMAETCRDMKELREKVAEVYGREPVQLTMYLPRI
jgi:hypothetical protein